MRLFFALSTATFLWSSPLQAATAPSDTTSRDPYLWLEDVTGTRALDWVKERNAESSRELTGSPEFQTMESRFLAILDSDAKIPYVGKIGDSYYNLWQDKQHARGLWRRTSLAEYRKERPAWETVLDLDSLSQAEKESWVWHGAQTLPPDYTRALVKVSRGGSDADVAREFDLGARRFVTDGFTLPEAKSEIYWKGRDTLYVGTDFGAGSMTTSGYPRIAKEWKRGMSLSQATTIFEGKPQDIVVSAYRDFTPGFERDIVYRGLTFFTNETFLRRGDRLVKIEKPDDADVGFFREWLLISLRTDWSVKGKVWPAGALLATRLDDFLAGQRDLAMLFEPTSRKSLASYTATRGAILLNELDNVRSKLYLVRFENGAWTRTPLPGLPEFGNIEASAVDPRTSDDYWLTITDFLTPTSLHLATAGGGPPEKLKQTPAFFDAQGLEVSQHEAVSKDGTRIPYFQISPKGLTLDGNAPTLLYGYGGFEISEVPSYSALRGSGWLEKGGVLVVANIRGGGEFGPKWHQAGMKDQRHHCYEDFIAVGEDLVKRKVTSPRHLGCNGGSNGGLLVGNMVVMRPDLFHAVVCQAPLLDMRRYHRLLAGASWEDEYGDPDDPKQWAFMKPWSPYQNVKKGVKYPRTLFMTSTRDDRVHPGHARKMAAKLRDLNQSVLYYENVEGGHGGADTNAQVAHMWAMAYTFLWKELK